MDGWIKLHRRFLKWEWYQDDHMVRLFIHLLLKANHESNKWKGMKIDRGQLVTGRKQLSRETGISEQSIRTCINRLKSTSELTIKPTNQYSIITICNYDTYQFNEPITNQQNNQPIPNDQPATNQRLTTNKNDKNDKNDKKNICLMKNSGITTKDVYKSFQEADDLNYADHQYYFNTAMDWSESNGKMKKDWIATVRNFARRDIREKKLKTREESRPPYERN